MRYAPLMQKSIRRPAKHAKPGDCPKHRAWVRQRHPCVINNHECRGAVYCCHLRIGTGGGTSKKPHDKWTWPGCRFHHEEQHRIGEASFQRKYGLDLRALCEGFARRSPDPRVRDDD